MASIASISPAAFDDGKPVTLTGSGFGASQGSVLIGGVAQNVNTWTDNQITFTTVRGSQSLGACRVDVVKNDAGIALFSDNFSTGDLSRTQNGIGWGASSAASVVNNKLRFYWNSTHQSEQRFTTGSTQYPEFWIKYDLTVDANYSHVATNNKGFLTLWSNTSGTAPNDGYSALDELQVRIEFWPNEAGDGGSKMALCVFGSGYDYNAPPAGLWQNGIAIADRGQTVQIIVRVKAGTYFPGDYSFWTPGDGVCQVWKNGALVLSKTDANMYKAGFSGFNRGYLFGYVNTYFALPTELFVDNVEIATTNIWSV